MAFALLIGLLATWSVFVWCRWKRGTRGVKYLQSLPTGLPTLPLLGHLHHLIPTTDVKSKFADFLTKFSSASDETYCMWLGPTPTVVLNHPEDIKFVLNSSKTLEKSEEYKLLKFATGDGIFTCKVSRWKITRGPMQSLVHPANLDHLVPGMNQRCQTLASRYTAMVGKGPADVYDTMYSFAVMNALYLVFGSDEDLDLDIDSNELRCIKEATEKGFMLFSNRLLSIWLKWDTVFHLLYWRQIQSLQETWNVRSEYIKKVFEEQDNYSRGSSNNEEYRISSNKNQGYDAKSLTLSNIYGMIRQQHPEITKQDFVYEAQTIIGGAADTVSVALSSCLLALASHPNIQERLYAEIVGAVGAKEGTVTAEDIKNMPYLDCVLKETLRRFTVVPFIMRQSDKEITLHDCKIPAYTKIAINMYGQNMNPKVFPEPQRFDPERFAPENTSQRDRYCYIPFCAGPRDCLGKQYTILLVKILMVTFMRQFKLATPDNINQLQFRYEVVLVSKTGYNIEFHKRV